MKANAVPLLAIFEKKMRLEVPLFQRQYVWSKDIQWEPLWEDISRKFSEYLEGRKDRPVHFLGAMVLDQKQTPTTHVERRQVIDGQQRLTTLQIFLAALRDFCRENDCNDLAKECEAFTLNKGMMAEPDVDKYKLWPTQLDRPQFMDVIDAGSRGALIERHPLVFKKNSRKAEPRPRMIEAYLFFYGQLHEFFAGADGQPPLASEQPLSARLEECFQSLKNALQVVAIDLEVDDDAQVIFETLNARGEPLLPADLLRNFIFLRAARKGESQELLYAKYWHQFDENFWRVEVKQGRLLRPRSDLFMQHFLASRQGVDIPIKHLFVEYKYWIEKKKPFETVTDELKTLARQGADFRRIIEPKKGDPIYLLATFLEAFDVRTTYPLMLALLDAGVDDEQWENIARILESYLLRRAVCDLSTKNYNRVFLQLTRNLQRDARTSENLATQLAAQTGESAEWPSDAAFHEAWVSINTYKTLNNPKIVHILTRMNERYASPKMDRIAFDEQPSVEHILPREWVENWPLPDGTNGIDIEDMWGVEESDPCLMASRKRNTALHTIGNLTILRQALNSSVSNSAWKIKKPAIMQHSLLPINQHLQGEEIWDESAILNRAEEMFQYAITIWPRH